MCFVCVNLRDLRETLWFRLVQYRLSTLACYSPADSADYAEEYSFAALFRRERLFGVAVLCFGFCLRLSARSAGDTWGFFDDRLSILA